MLQHTFGPTKPTLLAMAAATGLAPLAWASDVDIDAIMDRMTLEQKLGQLTIMPTGEPLHNPPAERSKMVDGWRGEIRAGILGSVFGPNGARYANELQRAAVEESDHKIPVLIANDIIHGYRTIFPIPLASSGSFNLELLESLTRAAAVEARAAGTHWTFAPMVDMSRDPRWGRIAEGAGEDPFYAARVAVARVNGFQGDDLAAIDTVMACAKHFAAYGGAMGGRDYDTVDISWQTLWTVHLPPFEAAVREANVGSLMTAFNETNGVPATADTYLLQEVLRERWGFDGFLVSDYTSIEEMVYHGFAADEPHAGVLAINAGTDIDMTSQIYREHLPKALEQGRVSMETINRSVRRVLETKVKLGLFENPFGDESLEREVTLSPEFRELAREAGRQSIIMLKNEGDLLPLDPTSGRIGVIGPLAVQDVDMMGTWKGMGEAKDVINVLEGLEAAVDGATISYVKGVDAVLSEDKSGFDAAVRLAENSDVVLMVVGETEIITGEANSRANLRLPGVQLDLVQAVHATGTPVVLLLTHGRPLVIPWEAEHVPAILATWHLGVEHGNAVADIVFGKANPSAKVTSSWPRHEGQIPVFYAHKSTGRPFRPNERFVNRYLDLSNEPQYAFGFGLSYTEFAVDNLTISDDEIGPAGSVTITARVTNTGDRAGAEVAQLYVRDRVASLTRPVKELRGFERVELDPGESATVEFTVGPEELGFWNVKMDWVVEPGDFDVWVGTDSDDERLHGEFKVVPRPAE